MENEAAAVLESPTMDVERGPLVNLTGEQRNEFRKTGNLPPKAEETASSTETIEVEKAGESEAPKSRERPKNEPKTLTASERISQIEAKMAQDAATIEKIRKGAGIEPKAESKPAKRPEPSIADTRPRPTIEDKKEDGTPKYASYEEFVEELADWKSEQREVRARIQQREQSQADQFKANMEAARGRRENFDEAVGNFREAIGAINIDPVVRDMLNDSDVFADLVAVIGGNKDDLSSFTKMAQDSPGKALRYIALTESLIAEELGEKHVEEVSVKPKTNAPRPPSEAGGRSATPPDALSEAVTSGDFRSAKAEMTRRALAKLKS